MSHIDPSTTPPLFDAVGMAENVLEGLRWHEDMVVLNYGGERVWLKPRLLDGVRIGITDCCPEATPCERHDTLRRGGSEGGMG